MAAATRRGPGLRGGAGRAGGAAGERGVGAPWPRLAADQPRQGAVPRRRAERGWSPLRGHETRPHPLRRHRRTGHPPVPGPPAGEPPPIPGWRVPQGLLAENGAAARAGLVAALAQRGRRSRRDGVVLAGGGTGRPGLAGQRRGRRAPSVDLDDRGPRRALLGDVRPRPRRRHLVRRSARARPAAPQRARAPRRPGLPEGERAARHPDPRADRAGLLVRGHPPLGEAGVAGRRCNGAGARELGVAQGRAQGLGPARLHAERHQPDVGVGVQPAGRGRCPGLGAGLMGRARRPSARTAIPCVRSSGCRSACLPSAEVSASRSTGSALERPDQRRTHDQGATRCHPRSSPCPA